MDHPLSLPALDVARLLHQFDLHPRKSLGQNFLVDEAALQKVIAAAEITDRDVILEVGPGLGSLTRLLALAARQVVAVEIDANLIPALKSVVAGFSNVEVIQGDILAYDPTELVSGSEFLVVANIPYYITSALIRHLLEGKLQPRRLVLTVQREVAERICAGQGDLSLLALSVQVYGHPAIITRIPIGAFYPPPRVDSAVIRIDLFASPSSLQTSSTSFFISYGLVSARSAKPYAMPWQVVYTSSHPPRQNYSAQPESTRCAALRRSILTSGTSWWMPIPFR